jgi:glycosyltransferase involved in cell wall biosynthesis
MKIAIYHPWLKSKGGAERVVLELAKRLKATVFTSYFDKKNTFEEFKKIPVKQINKIPPKGFLSRGFFGISLLFKKIKEFKNYDLLIVSTSGIGELITIRNHNIPIVCYCHTPLRAAHEFYNDYKKSFGFFKRISFMIAVKFYRILEKKSWEHFNIIFCNSKNTKSRIEKAKLAAGKKIKVVYPGIDTKKFKPIWKYKKYFFAPGRFKPYKRFELAIEAFKLFKMKIKGYKLIIAGYPDDKEYFEKIKNTAMSIGDIKIVKSPTDRQLIKLYQNCYAVLFTAKDEDWGLVPLEAMACGKPVIAVNEGGVRESIIDGKTGFLVKTNPQIFSNKMIKMVKSKKHLIMGKMARKYALNYDWSLFHKKIIEVINYEKYSFNNNSNIQF